METPKVSIIMGIYNCEKTLKEAIDSILAQTYTNWELIMCDDGSKDDTYLIAEEYVKQDSKRFILLKNEKNMGLNHTLNKCLQQATGEYVARMDGDDISLPDRLEKQVNFLLANPEFALVSCSMTMFDETGEWGQLKVIEYPEKKDFCTHSPFFLHGAVMIKRSVFLEVGGYTEKKQLLRVEDCHLWYKIYAKGYKGANINENLYRMRDDRNAIHRRTFSARMHGIYVTWVGFKMVKMPWYKYVYALKTTVVEFIKAIMPKFIYKALHKRRLRKQKV